jgi:hypothetical protein
MSLENTPHRPQAVTTLAVLQVILGEISLLSVFLLVFINTAIGAIAINWHGRINKSLIDFIISSYSKEGFIVWRAVEILVELIVLSIGPLLFLIVARGTLKLEKWAWRWSLVLSKIGAVAGIIFLPVFGLITYILLINGQVFGILGFLLCGIVASFPFIIIHYQRKPDVRAAFQI